MILDELEALEKAATPGPVKAANIRGPGDCDIIVDGEGDWLAEFESADDAAWYVAARNALPALLRVARAVSEEKAAALAMDKAVTDGAYVGAQARYNRAVLATAAALAALEAKD